MMKTILLRTSVFVVLFMCTTNIFADEFDVMYDRFYAESYAAASPSKASVDAVLARLNVNGSFTGINYASTGPVTLHLEYMNVLALAYVKTGNFYYHNSTVLSKYVTALDYWLIKNHQSSNWWDMDIGYPQTLSRGYVLVIKNVKTINPSVYSRSLVYLKSGYQRNREMAGANGADKIMGAFLSSIMSKSVSDMNTYEAHMANILKIQNNGEGVEVDWIFASHSWNGRQINANYCVEYLNSVLRYLTFTKGSSYYKIANVAFLENLYLNSIQWYIYNNHIDPSQTGRNNSSVKGVDRFTVYAKKVLDLNGPKAAQMAIVYDRLLNGKKAQDRLSANRMYWRVDYMVHRRPNYYVSSRMTSTRTVGMESAPGQRELNYYGGSGLNFIFRTGSEYGDASFFDVFNYRQWPGITVEQDNTALPTVHWGENAQGGNNYAGGVSDGKYGASAFIHQKRNVLAHKAWFYFDNEFVAMGSGITQTSGTAPVYTTLNQAIQNGTVQYSKNNSTVSVTGVTNVANPDWILQDSIAYLNLDPTSSFILSTETRSPYPNKIFTAAINHGTNPANATYAYIVSPNTSAGSVALYKANVPVQVLSNTKKIQAVYHKTLMITQVIFYQADSLILANGKMIKVSAPCALMLKDSADAYVLTVANPLCEKSNPAKLYVKINLPVTGMNTTWDGVRSTIVFDLPQGDYAGQSVRRHLFKNKVPVVTISSPVNQSTYTAPAIVNINANITDADGTISSVTFFEGSNWIGNDATAPYTLSWNNVPAGTYKISVKAIDNMGGVTYNSVNITVAVVTKMAEPAYEHSLVYPNPATGVLYLEETVEKIDMTNNIGTTFTFENLSNPLDLTGLTPGMYVVKVYTDSGETYQTKIVVQ